MFISFEGIDGRGKSTQLVLLRDVLEQAGSTVITIREPGATLLSESIREILLSNKQTITSTAELLLFSAARTQLVEKVIEPALEQGTLILCDRYVDSTTAYQGYGRMLDMENVTTCNRIATRGVMPSVTFFIDVAFEQAQRLRSCDRTSSIKRSSACTSTREPASQIEWNVRDESSSSVFVKATSLSPRMSPHGWLLLTEHGIVPSFTTTY